MPGLAELLRRVAGALERDWGQLQRSGDLRPRGAHLLGSALIADFGLIFVCLCVGVHINMYMHMYTCRYRYRYTSPYLYLHEKSRFLIGHFVQVTGITYSTCRVFVGQRGSATRCYRGPKKHLNTRILDLAKKSLS